MNTQNSDDFDFIVAAATQPQQATSQQIQQQQVQQVAPAQQDQVTAQSIYNNPVTDKPQEPQQVVQPVQAPVQEQVNTPVPEQPQTIGERLQQSGQVSEEPEFDLDKEIEGLFTELGISEKLTDQKEPEKKEDKKSVDNENNFARILEKLSLERDEAMDKLGQERYERGQLQIANEKLQNKLSELVEENTALQYDENRFEVPNDIKQFVHFYDKRSKNQNAETPDSALQQRMLAEAIGIIEKITQMPHALDGFVNDYYVKSNPQIARIGSQHYSTDQLGLNPKGQQFKSVTERAANDPNFNPMLDVF